jgi:predicted NAD-dependent protein-ADP-ribosyltransferase YbiA (DUF1768 family)
MVKSLLNKKIDYNEIRGIDSSDEEFDANLYETKVFSKTIVFALGQPNYLYIDQNIIYYPIYLVENDEIKTQIGIYEIIATNQENILDADGDIDLNKFDKPLLYSFAYEEIHESDIVDGDDNEEQSKKETKKSTKHKLWIQKFMKDGDYNIIDTKYDGNCFFSMVKLALEENGQDTTIDEMRDILSQNATDALFENYKTRYESLIDEEKKISREIKNITKRHNDLETTMKKTKDRNLSLSYIKQSDEMKKQHIDLKTQRKNTRVNVSEYEFMKGIDNLSMLKLKMKTSEFWADSWAISTLERELNLKTIIFSEQNFKEGDTINVLQCGIMDDKLEQKGKFEPSFYILACYYGGYHYQMITYKNEKSFNYSELPEDVKMLVVEKCLEKMAGPYSLIPNFASYKIKLNHGDDNDEEKVLELEKTSMDDTMSQTQMTMQPAAQETTSDLYNNGTIFRFYSKSIDKPLPGKGAGESIGEEGTDAYAELAKIPEWRKKLSNFWMAEFVLDKHRWASVEHYYQASKFKRNNKEFYIQFSLDSPDSDIAKDAGLAKAAGGKSGMTTKLVDGVKKKVLVRPKNVTIDPDFFKKTQGMKYVRGEMEMESAMRAKFTQNADLKKLLLATKNAKLEHITRGKPAIVFNDLMRVRREMKNESS